MTKKDYQKVASIIKEVTDPDEMGEKTALQARSKLAWAFVDLFTEDNPRFDPSRFLEACGLGRTSDAQTVCAYCGEREGHTPRCSVTKFNAPEQRTETVKP